MKLFLLQLLLGTLAAPSQSAAVLPSGASSIETSSSITAKRNAVSNRVFDALLSRGLAADELPATLDFSMVTVAREHDLRVQHISWDGVRRLIQIRLGCEAASPCMPVLIQAGVPPAMEARVRAKLTQGRRQPEGVQAENLPQARPRHAPILVKAGKAATLLWQRDGLRVTTPVVCLRSGEIGDQVPVRTREGKHLLNAQVVGVGMLAVF
jgi:Chaperone for flagella basal body P-ring formation